MLQLMSGKPVVSFIAVWMMLLLPIVTSAQNGCKCPGEQKYLATYEDYNKANDVVAIEKLCKELVSHKHAGCRTMGYDLYAVLRYLEKKPVESQQMLANEKHLLDSMKCSYGAYVYYYWAMGNSYLLQNDYENALKNYIDMLAVSEKDNDKNYQLMSILNISGIFAMQQQYDKAIAYNRKAINLLPFVKDEMMNSMTFTVIANAYTEYGYNVTKSMKDIDSGEYFALQALPLQYKNKDYGNMTGTYSGLSRTSLFKKQYTNSLRYADSAITLANHEIHQRELFIAYIDMATVYKELSKFTIAGMFGDSALMYAKQSGNFRDISDAQDLMYEVYRAMGNHKAALEAYIQSTEIKDSILTVEKAKSIQELEGKYNQAKNEKTIKELSQEQEIKDLRIRILTVAVFVFILVIFIVVILSRQARLRQKHKTLEIEQRLNRLRINPHFFFNALTTLQGLAIRENDGKNVATMLSAFSKLMRSTLEQSYTDYSTIENEIEFLKYYLGLQQLRFSDRFTYDFTVSEDIDASEVVIPSMILQPFLENAIEHGFKNLDQKGVLTVSFRNVQEELHIAVSDNGTGISATADKDHVSRATQIIQDRLYLLNKQKKTNARFHVTSTPGKGVTVDIYLPVMYTDESTSSR